MTVNGLQTAMKFCYKEDFKKTETTVLYRKVGNYVLPTIQLVYFNYFLKSTFPPP